MKKYIALSEISLQRKVRKMQNWYVFLTFKSLYQKSVTI